MDVNWEQIWKRLKQTTGAIKIYPNLIMNLMLTQKT